MAYNFLPPMDFKMPLSANRNQPFHQSEMGSSYKIKSGCFYNENCNKPLIYFPDIVCFNADGSYSKLFAFYQHQKIMVQELVVIGLCEIEEELNRQTDCFYRTHKSWYLNLGHIVTVFPTDKSYSGHFIKMDIPELNPKCTRDIYPFFSEALFNYRLRNGISC